MTKKELTKSIEEIRRIILNAKIMVEDRINKHLEHADKKVIRNEMKFLKEVFHNLNHSEKMLKHVENQEHDKLEEVIDQLKLAIDEIHKAE